MGQQIVHFHVGRSTHAFFVEQLQAAPEGFVYDTGETAHADGAATRRLAAQGRRFASLRARAEWVAIRSLSHAGYVRRARVEPPPGAAITHSAQLLPRECPLPYVVDFECVEAFTFYQRVALRRPWARKRLEHALGEERLRFLMPWSEASRRGLRSALGATVAEDLADRTVTVLPAVRPVAKRPREREAGPLRVLFVGTAFLAKGGVEAMLALRHARTTHEVVLDVVSDVPDPWRRRIEDAEGLTLHSWPVGADVLRALYERSDVLLFPSHMDTLGFVMMEAMAHGIPVLAARHFAVPEIVEHDVSGLVFESENLLYGEDGLCRFERTLPPPNSFRRALASPSDGYVERIASELARLAEDRELHARLAAGALERVSDGVLSMARRREQLGLIYRRALSG